MTIFNGYEQSDREQKLDILNLPSLEEEAKKLFQQAVSDTLVVVLRMNGHYMKTQVRLIIYKLYLGHLLTSINLQLILKFSD